MRLADDFALAVHELTKRAALLTNDPRIRLSKQAEPPPATRFGRRALFKTMTAVIRAHEVAVGAHSTDIEPTAAGH